MLLKLRFFFFFITSFFDLFACDVCNVFEYANRQNNHYIGVFYRNRMFNGFSTLDHNHVYQAMPNYNTGNRLAHEPDNSSTTTFKQTQQDFEFYQTVELRANYAISSKINVQCILPYNWSSVYYSQVTEFLGATKPIVKKDSIYGTSGIGDVVVMADYIHSIETGNWKHIIKPGLGLKLPTGTIQNKYPTGKLYHSDLQPGTGSLDILLRANYLVTNDLWGFDFFSNYRFCFTNAIHYSFGNRFNITTLAYYTLMIKSLKILPKVGIYTEFAKNDTFEGKTLQNTGGYTYFAHLGLDILLGNIVIQTTFQKPYFEYLYGDIPGNAGRLTLGLIYTFE